jgi:hypothetical protein
VKEREKRRPTKITQWIPREYILKNQEDIEKTKWIQGRFQQTLEQN